MPKQSKPCPYCDKPAQESSHILEGNERVILLQCGHTIIESNVSLSPLEELRERLTTQSGKSPRDFQLEGVQFGEKSNIRFLLSDEMALGKTLQACWLLKLHPEILPVIILCKRRLVAQWFHEVYDSTGLVPQIITDGKTPLYTELGYKVFIISLDSLRNVDYADKGIKTVIIDECQMIKNPDAKRTSAVRRLCKSADHIIAISGTPIKNNAAEYFTILNILRPEIFPDKDAFLLYYCDYIWTGKGYKVGGLNQQREDIFRSQTQDFIIRRRRDDVMPELPKINRTYQFIEISERSRAAWLAELAEFTEYFDGEGGGQVTVKNMMNILHYISRMRHLTGMAKVEAIIEWAIDYLEQRDDTKLTIFHHHKDVGQLIYTGLKKYCDEHGIGIVVLNPDIPAETSDAYIQNCAAVGWVSQSPTDRVAILSTLSNSEGLNLQQCDTAILSERQWNPANEEQAESRFPRPGSEAQSILINYPTAENTIDEWFGQLVEQKRSYMASTLDGEDYQWNESSLLKELAEITAAKGRSIYNPTREKDRVMQS